MKKTWMLLAVAVCVGAGAPLQAQVRWERGDQGWCDRDRGGGDRERSCEVLTTTLQAPKRITVDGGTNGGVNVSGWDRSEVQIRAKVWADAGSEVRAQEIEKAVRIRVDGGRISADGPDTGRRERWGVSYELMVPRAMDLDLETRNGGVSVTDVSGDIRFQAMNGGVHLARVGGDVRGRTMNGGLTVELAGDHWEGAGLDAQTTNGGVKMVVPENYSAELVTGTVNGGLNIDFPVTVRGRIGRQLRTTLGEGGAPIRVTTTNGGVRITRR
jgi:hypothetical protein